jgi:hypothetical protein
MSYQNAGWSFWMQTPASLTFIPRKSGIGARMVQAQDASLSASLRRLLLLADGRRNVFTLSQLLPDHEVANDVTELLQRGLLEDAVQSEGHVAVTDIEHLPEGWETASDFMVMQARETLGVRALDVVSALEHANSHAAAREAMSQWYRALRGSREGRELADQARLRAAAMLKAQAA